MVNRDQSLSPMGAGHHRRAVGVFTNCQAAEQALHDLSHAGFSMDRVSLIAKDVGRGDAVAGNKADEGAGLGAVSGGTLGGITGLLVGLGTLAIPGIGPIMLAGADATTLATTLGGGAIGAVAGSLIGGLIGLGIPETRARVYGDRVSQGDYLVMVVGTDREIRQAEAILSRHSIQEWDVYDLPTEQTQPSV
ncbi:MAG: general stress protein, partial [Leptolyngbyaceae bacterium]|nr:general stress protein [Leptolyngbyaceae bacterium]